MAKYIEREAACYQLAKQATIDGQPRAIRRAAKIVADFPAADVAPVRHGWWQITDAYPHNVYCSECHKRFAQTHWAVWEDGSLPREYCPNCGAKMDKESEDV